MEPGEYLFGPAADASQVSAVLSARYRVHVEPGLAQQVTFVDTADWRLYRHGLCLRDARQQRTGRLQLTDRDTVLATAPSPAGTWPRLVSTLPESPVRDRIAAAVGIRALLPLAQVGVHSLTFLLLDDEEKTRVRVRVDQQRLVGGRPVPLPLRVLVDPLRGYERDARRAAAILGDSLPPGPDGLDGATAAVLAAGLRPGESPVAPLLLDPQAPAVTSTAAVLRRWLDVLALARTGVLDDVDSEYLHDLRTAAGATRALLRVNADVLPAESTAHYAEQFAWLSETTGPLRDLDVMLLEIAGQGSLDVDGLALAPVRELLTRRRRSALRSVRAQLRSARGTELDAGWRATLDRWSRAPLTGERTGELVTRQARDAYRDLVAAGAGVTATNPPAGLSRLRQCARQLHHLFTSYESVVDPAARDDLHGRLQPLLDRLGEIHDAAAQSAQLSGLAGHFAGRKSAADIETLLCLGALRERLHRRDRAAREQIGGHLDRLGSARTAERLDRLAAAAARP